MTRLVALLCLLTVALTATSRAQTNPHGNDKLDCASCHNEASWAVADRAAQFDHLTTGFPLTGRHTEVACRSCHRDLVFAHVGTSCADCHGDPHRLRLGTDCAACHTTAGWNERGEMRRNHDTTRLPLVGAHERLDCDACHREPPGSDFAATPTDCYACHAADYAATTTPPHAASGFSTDCIACHGVFAASWGHGDFRHSASFPLTGAHRTITCVACHASGYTGTPTECVACHQADYDGTTDPAHAAAGFPTDCAACHNTNAWTPSNWNHDALFPINSGRHEGAWNTCADCHTVPANYAVFECIFCHEHSSSATDGHHDDVSGYQYLSAACYECHPRGNAGD
jgi:hypothetical protein